MICYTVIELKGRTKTRELAYNIKKGKENIEQLQLSSEEPPAPCAQYNFQIFRDW